MIGRLVRLLLGHPYRVSIDSNGIVGDRNTLGWIGFFGSASFTLRYEDEGKFYEFIGESA